MLSAARSSRVGVARRAALACSPCAWPPRSSPAARCWRRTPGSARGGRRCGSRSRSSRASSGRRRAAEGRRLPEDDEAFAVVEGELRADAAPTDGRRLAQRRRRRWSRAGGQEGRKGQERRRGRAGFGRACPAASSSPSSARWPPIASDDWRAGRRVRLPVQLRRPSRYLDPGVPDHERALARRGTTLVGTVKSGALVEVLARGRLDRRSDVGARAFARRAIADAVGRWSAQSARHRRGDRHRRSRRASTTTCSAGCRRPARIT